MHWHIREEKRDWKRLKTKRKPSENKPALSWPHPMPLGPTSPLSPQEGILGASSFQAFGRAVCRCPPCRNPWVQERWSEMSHGKRLYCLPFVGKQTYIYFPLFFSTPLSTKVQLLPHPQGHCTMAAPWHDKEAPRAKCHSPCMVQ